MNKNYDNEITILNNIIKIGIVQSVDKSKRSARVEFKDKGFISGPLKVIKYNSAVKVNNSTSNVEVSPWLPSVGEMVVCIFIPKGDGDGFILGGI